MDEEQLELEASLSDGRKAQDTPLIRTRGKDISSTPHHLGAPHAFADPSVGSTLPEPLLVGSADRALTLERFEASSGAPSVLARAPLTLSAVSAL